MRYSLVLVSQSLSIRDTGLGLAEAEVVTQALRAGTQMLWATGPLSRALIPSTSQMLLTLGFQH